MSSSSASLTERVKAIGLRPTIVQLSKPNDKLTTRTSFQASPKEASQEVLNTVTSTPVVQSRSRSPIYLAFSGLMWGLLSFANLAALWPEIQRLHSELTLKASEPIYVDRILREHGYNTAVVEPMDQAVSWVQVMPIAALALVAIGAIAVFLLGIYRAIFR